MSTLSTLCICEKLKCLCTCKYADKKRHVCSSGYQEVNTHWRKRFAPKSSEIFWTNFVFHKISNFSMYFQHILEQCHEKAQSLGPCIWWVPVILTSLFLFLSDREGQGHWAIVYKSHFPPLKHSFSQRHHCIHRLINHVYTKGQALCYPLPHDMVALR